MMSGITSSPEANSSNSTPVAGQTQTLVEGPQRRISLLHSRDVPHLESWFSLRGDLTSPQP